MNWKYSCGALCMGMALAACDGSRAVASSDAAAPRAGVDAISYAFAQAMQQDEVRAGVRDAMRASLVSEHKLVLQEFVGTESGRKLLESAARAAGTTPQALRAQIAALPEMDFYVASRAERLSWQGGGQVAVVATLSDDAPVIAGYNVRGQRVQLRGHNPVAGAEAVFVLHPAEVKHFRVHPQADQPGRVIQEAYDGEWAGAITERDAAGNLTTTQYADLIPGGRFPLPVAAAQPRAEKISAFEPFYVTTTGPGVFLTYFVPDFNDGSGACEMLFRTTVERPVIGSTTTDHEASSVECPGNHPWETRFPPRGRRSSATVPMNGYDIVIGVMEKDAFVNDNYGVQRWTAGSVLPNDYGAAKEYTPGTFLTVKWYGS